MGPFENRVLSFIQRHDLLKGVKHLLAAVSGGPDSVALLHLLHSLKATLDLERISVVHFDHRLRGEESRKDALFVRSMAEKLELPFLLGSDDVLTHQKTQRVSLEMAARSCRHCFFQSCLAECGAQGIALGHTANDQAEEIFLRLFRGTGPSGLAGMAPRTPRGIIRPVLFLTRGEILAYLAARDISYREDASNLSNTFWRNVVRNRVIPVVEKEFYPAVVSTLCRTAQLAMDEESYWAQLMEQYWQTVQCQKTRTFISLRLHEFKNLHPALQRRLLRHAIALLKGDTYRIEAVHVEDALQLAIHSSSGRRRRLPGALHVLKEGHVLVISTESPDDAGDEPSEMVVPEPGIYRFGSVHLEFSLVEQPALDEMGEMGKSRECAFLDAGKISWPLTVRCWRAGDRFQPLGMKGSKKLQDYFVDARVPLRERRRIPLVCDREKICWIVGYRLDERVRITGETRTVLAVETTGR